MGAWIENSIQDFTAVQLKVEQNQLVANII
jgi:hypothetical protein